MNILIAGASGYVGTLLIKKLSNENTDHLKRLGINDLEEILIDLKELLKY